MSARLLACAVTAALWLTPVTHAQWNRVLQDDFTADPSGRWFYNGVVPEFFGWDAVNGVLTADWDQSRNFSDAGDPYVIEPSYYSTPLASSLTDDDTFRFGATLSLRGSTIPDTTEFYQIANFGLYNLAETGPDRMFSDNFSGNSTLLKDGSDFVEFNYFINNNSFGFNPNVQPTIGAHVDGVDGDIITGNSGDTGFFHNTDMGPDHYLPEDTDLFVEVVYFGNATDATARRAYGAVYTDAARTTLLSVNGVDLFYWTQPVPAEKGFTLTDLGLANYVGVNFGGANGEGSGSFDDVYLDVLPIPEPATALLLLLGLAPACFRRRPRARTRASGQGFTLVEMLVVVAIVAILASFTAPALMKGRTCARRVACMSNLRQLQLAYQMYMVDHSGRFFPWREETPKGTLWYWGLETGGGGEGERALDRGQARLAPYFEHGGGIEVCPSFPFRESFFKQKFEVASYGYGLNEYMIAGTPAYHRSPVQSYYALSDPANTLTWADTAQVNTWQAPASAANPLLEEWYYVGGNPPPHVHFRHGGCANAAFADGSVRALCPDRLDQRCDGQVGYLEPRGRDTYLRLQK